MTNQNNIGFKYLYNITEQAGMIFGISVRPDKTIKRLDQPWQG
jgi:hypothetical protein